MATQEPGSRAAGHEPDLVAAHRRPADRRPGVRAGQGRRGFRRIPPPCHFSPGDLRVLQAAPRRGEQPSRSGHAVRMDTLHLVRAAAEFADTIERDAQEAATTQVGPGRAGDPRAADELQQQEAEIARIRQETERQRAEIMNAARNGGTRDPYEGEQGLLAGDAPGRVERGAAARAVPTPGDGDDECRQGRGRADARVGPRAGRRHRPAARVAVPSSYWPQPATAILRSGRPWTRSCAQPSRRWPLDAGRSGPRRLVGPKALLVSFTAGSGADR